jgi:hypothetical protein
VPYGLSEILTLQPIKYQRGTKVELGFGAQTTRPIIPEAVYDTGEWMGEGEPTQLGMFYTSIIPVLVKAVQELTARVEALEGI